MKNMQVSKLKWSLTLLFLFSCSLLTPSCKGSLQTKEEVMKYINDPDNGLQQSEKVAGVDIKLTYQPWELIASRLSSSSKNKDAEMKKYADKCFFILSFSKDGKELLKQLDYNTYSEMVQVFAFRMPGFISLLNGTSEPVPAEDCLFQQTYGASNANSLLLVFKMDDIEKANEFKIRVQDFGLGLGNIIFTMNKKDILNIHNIELKNL